MRGRGVACLADEVRGGEEALGAPERVVEVGAVGLELRGQPAVQDQAPAGGIHPPPHRPLRGAGCRPHHLVSPLSLPLLLLLLLAAAARRAWLG